jgi:uncharacterized Zn finger protein
MVQKEFLKAEVQPCPSCGNKVKPKIDVIVDSNYSFKAPKLHCENCGLHSDKVFWPNELQECVNSWNSQKASN